MRLRQFTVGASALIILIWLFLAILVGCGPVGKVVVEESPAKYYLIIKNTSKCLTIDFQVYEMFDTDDPLLIAGGAVIPGERKEFKLPAGKYCVPMAAKKVAPGDRDGPIIGKTVKCGVLPDPTIPKNARSVIHIIYECPNKRHHGKVDKLL